MPKMRCLCDTVINLSAIPNRQEFHIVWDPDVETFIESLVTAHQQATSNNENFAIQAYNLFYLKKTNFPEFLECPNCGRLIVFTLAESVSVLLEESAAPLNGLATVSAVDSADNIPELIKVPIVDDVTTPVESPVSAANLVDESAVPEDAIAVSEDVSAISSANELATPLDEFLASSADESASESASEPLGDMSQYPTRKQLGKRLGVTRETIRKLEELGKLAEKGYEPIPGTGIDTSPVNPRRYRPIPR